MDKEIYERFQKISSDILSKPPGKRKAYLRKLRQRDLRLYDELDHLIQFLEKNRDLFEAPASEHIKRIVRRLDREN